MDNEQLKNYTEAFTSNSAGCLERCPCGRVFYDVANSWDWEEGELERLKADESATPLEYSVERVIVNGELYATDCNCWHEIASRVTGFLDNNAEEIKTYYRLEKERLEQIARNAVVIDVSYDDYKDGWRHIAEAPRDATWLEVLMRDRTTKEAHWAQDLSGEEQPPFRGWFEKRNGIDGFVHIEDPIAWRYLEAKRKAA